MKKIGSIIRLPVGSKLSVRADDDCPIQFEQLPLGKHRRL